MSHCETHSEKRTASLRGTKGTIVARVDGPIIYIAVIMFQTVLLFIVTI